MGGRKRSGPELERDAKYFCDGDADFNSRQAKGLVSDLMRYIGLLKQEVKALEKALDGAVRKG